MSDDDLIRRGDARRVMLAYASSYSAEEAETAIAAIPAVTPGVRVKPLRYFFAEGNTVDEVREHARSHPLARQGDMKLVWVNEGDLYNRALDLTQQTAPAMRPETDMEHIARDMREARFPERSERQMISVDPQPAPDVAGLVEAAKAVLRSLDDLIAESTGIAGLHLNGDIAEWDTLEEGASCSEWLKGVHELRAALAAMDGKV